jgi:hypothetical protein
MKIEVSMPTHRKDAQCAVSYKGGRFTDAMPASEAEKTARRFKRAGDQTAHVILCPT